MWLKVSFAVLIWLSVECETWDWILSLCTITAWFNEIMLNNTIQLPNPITHWILESNYPLCFLAFSLIRVLGHYLEPVLANVLKLHLPQCHYKGLTALVLFFFHRRSSLVITTKIYWGGKWVIVCLCICVTVKVTCIFVPEKRLRSSS